MMSSRRSRIEACLSLNILILRANQFDMQHLTAPVYESRSI
jgi:hypothetical protein